MPFLAPAYRGPLPTTNRLTANHSAACERRNARNLKCARRGGAVKHHAGEIAFSDVLRQGGRCDPPSAHTWPRAPGACSDMMAI